MKIRISVIKTLANVLTERAIHSGIDAVAIEGDSYWFVEPRTDMKLKNPMLSVGSLNDDWNWLEKLLSDQGQPTCVDFERLGNILIAIGEGISKSEKVIL